MNIPAAAYSDLLEMALTHEARSAKLLKAFRSIANSTCCGSCQEAALVARAALEEVGIDYRSVPSAMLTPYGKERQEEQAITDLLAERDTLSAHVAQLESALRDLHDDIVERFDMLNPSTNVGLVNAVEAARAALRGEVKP